MTAAMRMAIRRDKVRAAGSCTVCEYAGLFLVFSAAGWLWEVALHVLLDGELVNRGTLLGPWLPICGVGGLAAVMLLGRFAARPPVVCALGMLLSTGIEYATGKYLLAIYGQRWWDYSRYPLNIDGLISPLTSLLFGLGCCAAVYMAAPMLLRTFRRMPYARLRMACVLLMALFVLDFGVSTLHPNVGQGVTVAPVTQDGLRVIEPAQIGLLLQNLPK